jgi:uroporphyrinogen-III decarboxylase
MSMTSRERIESALRHRTPDRTPMFEYVLLSPLADILLGRLYAGDPDNWAAILAQKGWEGAVRQNAVDRVELAERLGNDMIYAIPNPPPPGTELPPWQPASEDPVERLQERNRHVLETPSAPADDTMLVYVYMREEMARRGLDLPLLAPAYSHGVWTDVDLMQTMLLAPEVAHEHFRLATQRSLGMLSKCVALGIEQIGVGGDFAGTVPIISPKAYRTFIVPEVRAVSRAVHQAGRWAVNASDGNLWSVIEDFLFGCEVDAYLEIDLFAGMDLRALKERYGKQFTLYGNMDCGNLLSFGSVEDVRRETVRCLEAGWGDGGHIFCASNAITASVPLSNYLAMIGAYREFFALPPQRLDS